jgi:Ca2+-binding RTX toxin-like protein
MSISLTNGNDIYTLGSTDTVFGLNGNDRLTAAVGVVAKFYGQNGNDRLVGNSGDDYLSAQILHLDI